MKFDAFQSNRKMKGHGGQKVRYAITAGAKVAGDGGGGTWLYSPESTAEENEGTVLKSRGINGRWLRQFSGPLDPRWWGAVPGSTRYKNNAAHLNEAIKWAVELNIPLDFGGMQYHCTDSLFALTVESEKSRLVMQNGNLSFSQNLGVGFHLGGRGKYKTAQINNFSIGRLNPSISSPFGIGLHVKNVFLIADSLRIGWFGAFRGPSNTRLPSDAGGIGLLLDSTHGGRFTSCYFDKNMTGAVLMPHIRKAVNKDWEYDVIPANENKFWGCSFRFNTGPGAILMCHPHHTKLLDQKTKQHLGVSKGDNGNGFSTCWFEDNFGPALIIQAGDGTTITESRFEKSGPPNTVGTPHIELDPFWSVVPPELQNGLLELNGVPPFEGGVFASRITATRIALNFFADGDPVIRSRTQTIAYGSVAATRFLGNYFALDESLGNEAVELTPVPTKPGEEPGPIVNMAMDVGVAKWERVAVANVTLSDV